MAQTLDPTLEPDQELSRGFSLAPPLSVPRVPGIAPSPGIAPPPDIAPFGFAPAPTVPAACPVSLDRPAPRVRPRRRLHLDWYESAVILLILSCMALCVTRCFWAIHP